MTEDTSFLTDDKIYIVCATTRKFETYNFVGCDDDGLRRYECQCGCGRNRIFPPSLPDSRYEDNGYGLIESTNRRAMGYE